MLNFFFLFIANIFQGGRRIFGRCQLIVNKTQFTIGRARASCACQMIYFILNYFMHAVVDTVVDDGICRRYTVLMEEARHKQ